MNEIALSYDIRPIFRKKIIRVIVFLTLTVWCLGFTFASLFPKSQMIIVYPLIKQFYSSVCHQINYKCIEINGINFLVCARCSGIYFGALLSSAILLFFSGSNTLDVKYIVIASIPMFIDVVLYSTGIYSYSKFTALSTGLIFGFVSGSFIIFSIENLLLKKATRINELT